MESKNSDIIVQPVVVFDNSLPAYPAEEIHKEKCMCTLGKMMLGSVAIALIIATVGVAYFGVVTALKDSEEPEYGRDDPVILVHGFAATNASWQYIDEFVRANLTVGVVDVSKFASNFDRAAEVYAQIKGTVVDYGACHSVEFDHIRFGEDYTGRGIYEVWDDSHPVHFIGHSMGGQTIRMLERLLRVGSGCSADESELFTGGHNRISSITTLSSPLDGTVLVEYLVELGVSVLLDVVAFFAEVDDTLEYNFESDAALLGLSREEDENIVEFLERVDEEGKLSVENVDLSLFDLSPEGARIFNSNGVQVYEDTFYFAYATERTSPVVDCFGDCIVEIPEKEMSNSFFITGSTIGSRFTEENLRVNDGVVPLAAARCPTVNGIGFDECVEFDGGSWSPGKWYFADISFLDHAQITAKDDINDRNNFERSALKIYLDIIDRIIQLNEQAPKLAV